MQQLLRAKGLGVTTAACRDFACGYAGGLKRRARAKAAAGPEGNELLADDAAADAARLDFVALLTSGGGDAPDAAAASGG
eukprot:SAG11_NODE_6577_length_1285_cov_3.741990_2_plen_79_part_01